MSQLFLDNGGPIWVDVRPHRGGETEEDENDPEHPLIGFWICDERILQARGDHGNELLFCDSRGPEYALADLVDWLADRAAEDSSLELADDASSMSMEEAVEWIESRMRCGYKILPLDVLGLENLWIAVIGGDNEMEIYVIDPNGPDGERVSMISIAAFDQNLVDRLERQLQA